MPFTSPHHLKFNHTYTETLYLDANQVQPEAFRVVRRTGVYAPAADWGAGVTFFERYGARNLAFNAFGVDVAVNVPDLRAAIDYPVVGGTAVLAGDILKIASTNTFYTVPANATLDAVGATFEDRVANDVAAGDVIPVPANLILNNLNSSSIPYAPSVLGHQRIIPICTDGIAIVEIATIASAAGAGITAAATITVDDPLYVADAEGRVGTIAVPAATDVVVGRALDTIDVPAAASGLGVPAGYIRIKLGSIQP